MQMQIAFAIAFAVAFSFDTEFATYAMAIVQKVAGKRLYEGEKVTKNDSSGLVQWNERVRKNAGK